MNILDLLNKSTEKLLKRLSRIYKSLSTKDSQSKAYQEIVRCLKQVIELAEKELIDSKNAEVSREERLVIAVFLYKTITQYLLFFYNEFSRIGNLSDDEQIILKFHARNLAQTLTEPSRAAVTESPENQADTETVNYALQEWEKSNHAEKIQNFIYKYLEQQQHLKYVWNFFKEKQDFLCEAVLQIAEEYTMHAEVKAQNLIPTLELALFIENQRKPFKPLRELRYALRGRSLENHSENFWVKFIRDVMVCDVTLDNRYNLRFSHSRFKAALAKLDLDNEMKMNQQQQFVK